MTFNLVTVKCTTCGDTFRSSNPAPHPCPVCNQKAKPQ